ncbi:hypothetical protein PR048_031866 [Dryococelus australis]|uniref:Uncharacterized protein n=1 Tax=Dryococelus australis TaxID=614101 RepID=A0ABQ9G6I1_9NEOP|nr:hypothetical protein PR048_031866 [Dryococelus australis]
MLSSRLHKGSTILQRICRTFVQDLRKFPENAGNVLREFREKVRATSASRAAVVESKSRGNEREVGTTVYKPGGMAALVAILPATPEALARGPPAVALLQSPASPLMYLQWGVKQGCEKKELETRSIFNTCYQQQVLGENKSIPVPSFWRYLLPSLPVTEAGIITRISKRYRQGRGTVTGGSCSCVEGTDLEAESDEQGSDEGDSDCQQVGRGAPSWQSHVTSHPAAIPATAHIVHGGAKCASTGRQCRSVTKQLSPGAQEGGQVPMPALALPARWAAHSWNTSHDLSNDLLGCTQLEHITRPQQRPAGLHTAATHHTTSAMTSNTTCTTLGLHRAMLCTHVYIPQPPKLSTPSPNPLCVSEIRRVVLAGVVDPVATKLGVAATAVPIDSISVRCMQRTHSHPQHAQALMCPSSFRPANEVSVLNSQRPGEGGDCVSRECAKDACSVNEYIVPPDQAKPNSVLIFDDVACEMQTCM